MPCVDHGDCSDVRAGKNLAERNDELAAELCKVRSLILHLSKTAPARSGLLGPNLMEEMEEQIEKFKIHRNLDKERALLLHTKKKTEISNNISKIKGLGGYPSENLLNKLAAITQIIEDISSSNPLETTLY